MRTACQCAVTCVCVCVWETVTLCSRLGDRLAVMHVTSTFNRGQTSFSSRRKARLFFHSLICVRALLINGLPRQHHYAVNSDECHMLYREVDGQELSVCVASLWRIGCPPHTLADEWG